MPKRSAAGTLLAALGVGSAFGVATGLALGLAIGWLNGWGAGRDAWLVGLQLAGLYALLFALGLGVLALGALVLGRRPGARFFLATAVAGSLLLNGVLRYNLAVQFTSVIPHMTWLGSFNLLALVCASALVFWALLARRPGRLFAGLAGAAVPVLVVHFANVQREAPLERDLAEAVPAALASAPEFPVPRTAEGFANTKLLVLGFDGLSFEVLLPLLRSGHLPGFRAFLDGAAYGHLETHPKPTSPVVWESISTGRPPAEHGIGYHVHFEFPGTADRVRLLPQFLRGKSPMALRQIITRLSPWAPWDRVPSDSTDARVARFYDVAAARGLRVGSFNWMNTGPVYPLNGWLRGFGPVPPRAFPEDLLEGLPPLPEASTGPIRVGADYAREREVLERAEYDRFVRLAQARPAELLLFYTHYHDALNHLNWKQEAHGDGFFISGAEHPDFEPGETTGVGMRFLDDIVLDVLSRIPDDTLVVIVSDHGFDFRGLEHDNGPPGVWMARGPGIRAGPFLGAHVNDVAPTLLHWLGLPVADDMKGTVAALAAEGGPLDRPTEHVASYGAPHATGARQEADPDALREHEEYLRALGYVN